MEKDTKEVVKGFFNSKTITQLIIVIIIMFMVGIYFFNENKQDNDRLKELIRSNANVERLVNELIIKQGKMDVLVRCVKKAHTEASDEFSDFKKVLGETLYKAGITKFPQELNMAFDEYGKKFEIIEDCLIFPEDLK